MSTTFSSGGPGAPRTGSSSSRHKGKLYHTVPAWVPAGSRFHVRIRLNSGSRLPLNDPKIATALLESAAFYHAQYSWYVWVMVLMPDHLHAVLSFPPGKSMSRTIGDWKKYQAHVLGLDWQDNYFDHCLRNESEFGEKAHYIRMNPVRAGLCETPGQWPWVLDTSGGPGASGGPTALRAGSQNPSRRSATATLPVIPPGGPTAPRAGSGSVCLLKVAL